MVGKLVLDKMTGKLVPEEELKAKQEQESIAVQQQEEFIAKETEIISKPATVEPTMFGNYTKEELMQLIKQKEMMELQLEAMRKEQEERDKPIVIHVLLNNGFDVEFRVQLDSAEELITKIKYAISSLKVLEIEKKTIPVEAISMVYWE